MGDVTLRSLGKAAQDDGTVLSRPGRRATTLQAGVVDTLSFSYQSTTPKIGTVTAQGLDHTLGYRHEER
jgi:hypothetical protein